MNYYILFYETVADYIERRVPFRNEHLKMATDYFEKGHLKLAGALADPADSAILVFHGENESKAVEFAQNDPYVKNGVVVKWYVRKWTVVVGA